MIHTKFYAKTLFFTITTLLISCDYFRKAESKPNTVVRVDNDFLYKSDIEKILPPNYTFEDSVRVASSYVNNWALRKLLLKKAEENISDEKKAEFENLVAQYRTDLYTQSYMEMLVNKQIDTIVSRKDEQKFYDENKTIFKLNEDLLKFRYIHINEKDSEAKNIINRFKRFDKKDKKELNSLSLHMISFFINDSVWVKANDVYEKLPFLESKLDGKSGDVNVFLEQHDSLGIYLIKVDKLLKKSSEAPLEYAKPTLKQIILNRRKSDYINELEKDIINQAIKKKQFEIYEQS